MLKATNQTLYFRFIRLGSFSRSKTGVSSKMTIFNAVIVFKLAFKGLY